MDADINSCDTCEICNGDIKKNVSGINVCDSNEKCNNWLDNNCASDDVSVCSEFSETSSGSMFTNKTNNSAMNSGYVFDTDDVILENRICSYQNDKLPYSNLPFMNKETPKYEHINIYKSRKVHIGDVTIIKGPLIVNTAEQEKRRISENDKDIDLSNIISRLNWLAQPALGKKEYLNKPAKYVIIAHTATEEGFTQAENTLLVRLIQTFHIESRKWTDIAYNFLIGSDGLIYEGRGWGVQGAHTRAYNKKSIGISFIGCFLEHLPPRTALKRAKELIECGVKRGSIIPDYVLLAHCQCTAVESPGKRLYEELKSWENWEESISVNEPPRDIDTEEELSQDLLKTENIP